jgi:hypothetical protein
MHRERLMMVRAGLALDVDLRLELRIDDQRGDLFVGDGEVIIERDRAAGKSS